MNETNWNDLVLPILSIEKLLEQAKAVMDGMCEQVILPKTPKAAEAAFLKVKLECIELERKLIFARTRYDLLLKNFCEIRLAQLTIGSDNRADKEGRTESR